MVHSNGHFQEAQHLPDMLSMIQYDHILAHKTLLLHLIMQQTTAKLQTMALKTVWRRRSKEEWSDVDLLPCVAQI